jgi:hypothetical protein
MPLSPLNYVHLRNGRFSADTETQAADVERLLDAYFAAPPPNGFIFHFHGGLVTREGAKEVAELLLPRYQAAEAYPVFYVWESGLWETVRNNLEDIAKEGFFQRLLARVVELSLSRLGTTPGAKAPAGVQTINGKAVRMQVEGWVDGGGTEGASAPYDDLRIPPADQEIEPQISELQIAGALEADLQLRTELGKISNGLVPPGQEIRTRAATVQGSSATLMSPEGLAKLTERPVPGAKGVLSMAKLVTTVTHIIYRVVKRMANGRGHGTFTTSVEEILRELYIGNIGKEIFWDQMKKDTADAFGDDPAVFGGTAFLEGLRRRLAAGAPVPRITLQGHSTGAVFISNLLLKADQVLPPEVQFDVVFLAPAVSFHDFDATIARVPHRIRHLRSFGMKDELEQVDGIVPVIYPRSLLYFVSGLLEDEVDRPLVGMQRYHSGERPYVGQDFADIARSLAFLNGIGARLVWAEMDSGDGLRSRSHKHGDFDDHDPPTLESVVWLLEHGF